MRLLLGTSLVITLTSITVIVLALGLGSIVNQRPRIFHQLDACTLPCWNGITPGRTPVELALNILSELGYRRQENTPRTDAIIYYAPENSGWCDVLLGFSERKSPPVILYMNLRDCPGLRMGDLAAMLGDMEGVVVERQWGWGPAYRRNSVRLMSWQRLSVETDDFFVSLVAPNNRLQLPWHGFVTLQRYCHFQPNVCRRRSW